MTRRDDRVFLVDMLNHAREAVELLGNAGSNDLTIDRVTELALRKLVEVVGEAAYRVFRRHSSATLKSHGLRSSERATGWFTATTSSA